MENWWPNMSETGRTEHQKDIKKLQKLNSVLMIEACSRQILEQYKFGLLYYISNNNGAKNVLLRMMKKIIPG